MFEVTRCRSAGLALAVMLVTPCAVAQDALGWRATAELGAIATTGNTESVTIQGKVDATQELEQWRNEYILNVLFKEDQIRENGTTRTEKTAERSSGSIKSAYKLDGDNDNLFVYASHTDDKFGSYRNYTTVSAGYGNRIYGTDRVRLDVEIGPGYYWANQQFANAPNERDTGFLLRSAARYDWQFSETAEFKQTLSVEYGEDNTRTVSDSSISARLMDALQLKVGVNLSRDSDVAPDKEKTDTTTYVNMVYRF